jgi:hypothetical protein
LEKKAFASQKKFKEAGKCQTQMKEIEQDIQKWQEEAQNLRVTVKALEVQL